VSAVAWKLVCVRCGTSFPGLAVRYRCTCGDVLDVVHDTTAETSILASFDARRGSSDPVDRSGVWRFRELVLPLDREHIVTRPEGNTNLYASPALTAWCGIDDLRLKHEGENPTGSFKDRGMTVGISVAKRLGLGSVACASTGNTSASMASYAAAAGMSAYVFIPGGAVAYGKLAQSLAYGARTIQIDGDFDAAMALVERVCEARGVYLVNSINPFRIEGQKAIAFELLQDLRWTVPDWIVIPGGNLGNSSAIFKGLAELRSAKLIPRIPKIAVVQAAGANPFYRAFVAKRSLVPLEGPETLATAIRIGNPVSWRKSLRGVVATGGTVEEVSDQEIMDAKAKVDASGIGAEPASSASVAGIRKLVASGVIRKGESVVAILTGHLLKDPDAAIRYHQGKLDGIASTHANAPVRAAATLESVLKAMD
jgi:threonine synthase